jgi:hypothetical protein
MGAIEHSIQDYVTKAGQTGLLSHRYIALYNLDYLVTITMSTVFTTRLASPSYVSYIEKKTDRIE